MEEIDLINDDETETLFDGFVDFVNSTISQSDGKISVIDSQKMKLFSDSYKVIKHITKGDKLSVDYNLHEPFTSVGYITITGKKICFKNPKLFVKVIEASSNFEVYPKVDGSITMNFTFHGITEDVD